MNKFPYCAEYIKAEAKICRYCGKEQPENEPITHENKDILISDTENSSQKIQENYPVNNDKKRETTRNVLVGVGLLSIFGIITVPALVTVIILLISGFIFLMFIFGMIFPHLLKKQTQKEVLKSYGIALGICAVLLGVSVYATSAEDKDDQPKLVGQQVQQKEQKQISVNTPDMVSIYKYVGQTIGSEIYIDNANIFSVSYQGENMYLVIIDDITTTGDDTLEFMRLVLLNPNTMESATIDENTRAASSALYETLGTANDGLKNIKWDQYSYEDKIMKYIKDNQGGVHDGGTIKAVDYKNASN